MVACSARHRRAPCGSAPARRSRQPSRRPCRSGTHPPQGEGGEQAAAVGDAARGDHRHLHRVDDLWHERQRSDRAVVAADQEAAAVAARLGALRHDGVYPARPPDARLLDRGGRSRARACRPSGTRHRIGAGQPEVEAHDLRRTSSRTSSRASSKPIDRHAGLGRRPEPGFVIERLDRASRGGCGGRVDLWKPVAEEVELKGPIGQLPHAARPARRSSSGASMADPRAPSPPALDTAAASSGVATLTIGA